MARTPPLLLIPPGMMCDGRLFAPPQIAAFSGTRAVQVAPLDAHDTVQALAADILAGAPEQFALAGLSMGGIVAMEVLRQAPPERVERLALLDTNPPRAELDEVKEKRGPQMNTVRAGGGWSGS